MTYKVGTILSRTLQHPYHDKTYRFIHSVDVHEVKIGRIEGIVTLTYPIEDLAESYKIITEVFSEDT